MKTTTHTRELHGVVACTVTYTVDETDEIVGEPEYSAPYLTDGGELYDDAETGAFDPTTSNWEHDTPDSIRFTAINRSGADVLAMDELAALLRTIAGRHHDDAEMTGDIAGTVVLARLMALVAGTGRSITA